MRRRKFIRSLPGAMASAFAINQVPLRTFSADSTLARLASSASNDRVVVFIQLHGGNDGLNTLVPLDQYDRYAALRQGIALNTKGARSVIPVDSLLGDQQYCGLHPDASDFKRLYEDARLGIVQNVAYNNVNGSHFRSRDIWFMGGDYDDFYSSGWMGRYLEHAYESFPVGYPNDRMPDPPGLEIGNGVSLAFHRDNGVPSAISINDPERFYDLVTSVGGEPPEPIAGSYYGRELAWIMDTEQKANQYAVRLKEVYDRGRNSGVDYPSKYPHSAPQGRLRNRLAPQLKMVARLLSGGIKTKIFLTRLGGFDTHANQALDGDPSMGTHAALLYHLSSAARAFQDDLKALGLERRVLTVTFSEFGRRAKANGSLGTDHGTAQPMFVMGRYATPGVIGNNPDLSNLNRNNLVHMYDYRQLMTAILMDWLEADEDLVRSTRFSDYIDIRLPIVNNRPLGVPDDFSDGRFSLTSCHPNPADSVVHINYVIATKQHIDLFIVDLQGRVRMILKQKTCRPGSHSVTADVSSLHPGVYLMILRGGGKQCSRKFVKTNR